jgi:hypothetical protein
MEDLWMDVWVAEQLQVHPVALVKLCTSLGFPSHGNAGRVV